MSRHQAKLAAIDEDLKDLDDLDSLPGAWEPDEPLDESDE